MKGFKVSLIGLISNIALFIIKLFAGIMSQSIAVISDAFNSLSDIIASIAVLISVKVSEKSADMDHPFGHTRAQPIGGLIVAIFAGVIGFEIMINSFERFFMPRVITEHYLALGIILIAILIKICMYVFFRYNEKNNPAIKASAIDARNDVLLSLIVIIALVSSIYGVNWIDSVVGLVVAVIIIKSGFDIGIENIDYLMGKAPGKEMMVLIKYKLSKLKIKDIKDFKQIKAHYVGNFVHVALTVKVSRRLSTKRSHDIGEKVKATLRSIENVDQAFIHIGY